ncbi:MAG: LD-carboxypeptidase [Proteobacteria bacterium]|nr:LD-carboxypeptidase [Pseudomonadota bacterium]
MGRNAKSIKDLKATNHLFNLGYDDTFNIGVVAPAGKPSKGEQWNELDSILPLVPGLTFDYPDDICVYNDAVPPYHANTDGIRLKYLYDALTDNNTDFVWCMLGGYGAARILDDLNARPIPKQKKLLVGYSDITDIHLYLYKQWGWKSIHGAMLLETMRMKDRDSENFQAIFDILNGTSSGVIMNDLHPLNALASHTSSIKGTVVGGNLTMCETSIDTKWQLKSKNNIVMFEDGNEPGYAIDRSLYHLKEVGLLDDAAAIVFGTFSSGDNYVDYALQRFADEIGVPVFKTDEFGHSYYNKPFIHGAMGEIVLSGDTATLYQSEIF